VQARSDASGEGRRYAFGAAAARPEAGAKRSLFERFVNDPQLPESWIEEALGPMNELDHAGLTRELLEPALRELPALKRERRIFFVNGWLAAFIGGQSSADALTAVQRFLDESDLDPDLRLKVLEAVDVLERTVRIRAAFP
jgi:aminopeptidase N